MTKNEFANALRILKGIDSHELQEAGITPAVWPKFYENVFYFFIHCDDETADKIWSIIDQRSTPKPEMAGVRTGGGAREALERDLGNTRAIHADTEETLIGLHKRRIAELERALYTIACGMTAYG